MPIQRSPEPFALKLLQASIFPLGIGMTLAVMYLSPAWGLATPAAQMLVFIGAIFIGVIAERFMPHHPDWRQRVGKDTLVDAGAFGAMLLAVDPFAKAVSPALLSSLLVLFARPGGFQIIPEAWPFAAQLAVAAAIAEFGPYWLHRAAHRGGWLWRVHSIHHSARRIYWLNSYRAHPVNILWHYFSGAFVLLLLGIPTHVIQTYLALAAVVSVFQHCNARLRLGWLNYVFSTNEIHRWHHSTELAQANNNYGNVLMVWDLLFGTFYHRRGESPHTVGLAGNQALPEDSFWRLMAWPFRKAGHPRIRMD